MTHESIDRIEDYLYGRLADEETRQFEKDLTREETGAAFREVLLMRELLKTLPPDEPPPGLVDRIEASLDLGSMQVMESDASERTSSFGQIVHGLKWTFLWPGYALTGINKIGYSLGPLQEPTRDRLSAVSFPKKPLWKIVLSKLW